MKNLDKFSQLDHRYVWHPFTQMREWLGREPIVISRGKGATLIDTKGRRYLDGNSSIWTNLHGHNHPHINSAIKNQLKSISHSSYLGLANEPASVLAEKLVQIASIRDSGKLKKVFYSDDGSTAVETALKLSHAYTVRTAKASKSHFLGLQSGYHGDTIGAVSVGRSEFFHREFKPLLFKTTQTPAPYCYRCPHNKAGTERVDARESRKCKMECLQKLEKTFELHSKKRPITAFMAEPLIQGAAGMIAQPEGWLKKAVSIAKSYGAQFIADEVMTGFGRTGKSFACHQEKVEPDFLCLAKGMTGGYLPMAATLTTQNVFDVFLGSYGEFKTFFHGHSYTGNQLGAAASLASLELLRNRKCQERIHQIQNELSQGLKPLWKSNRVGDIRQVGLIVGIELVQDIRTRKPYPLADQAGIRVCRRMAEKGVLTRPIGNVVVIMPPYAMTTSEVYKTCEVVKDSINEILA